jgi:hypothetical protein
LQAPATENSHFFVCWGKKEILPLTDILPLATLCWVVDTFYAGSDVAKLLQVGRFGTVVNGSDRASAIDVESTIEGFGKALPGIPDQKDNKTN